MFQDEQRAAKVKPAALATAWMRGAERREPAMLTSRLIATFTLASEHVSRETSQVRAWKWTVGIGCVKACL
jgi:hypothetical protein